MYILLKVPFAGLVTDFEVKSYLIFGVGYKIKKSVYVYIRKIHINLTYNNYLYHFVIFNLIFFSLSPEH